MANVLVLVLVFLFNVIAFGLAIAAEQRRSTAHLETDSDGNYTYCVYTADISTGFGAGAFVMLLVSQLLIMAVSKCFCCGKSLRPGGARAWAVVLFILCWITFIVAELCLLAGSVNNAKHTRYKAITNVTNVSCETLRKGVFAAGAAFTFFTAILSSLYYVSFSKANTDGDYGKDTGVGMGPYR